MWIFNGTKSTTQLKNIPLAGYPLRLLPSTPSLDLRGSADQFCVEPGLRPRLYLDLPPSQCENQCVIGVFAPTDTFRVRIAHLPAVQNGGGTFDLLVDTFPGCIPGSTPTTLRMAAAIRYGSIAGDCNGDGRVRIDELLLGIMLALGEGSLTDCVGLDLDDNGMITINELIAAVAEALNS